MPKRTDIRTVVVGLLVTLMTASSAFSCTYSQSDVLLRRNFSVEMKNGATPLEGLTVEIKKISNKTAESSFASVTTDRSGVAAFSRIPTGRYYVIIQHPWLRQSIAVKVVSTKEPGVRDKISLDWPGNVLKTSSLAGRILAPRKTGNAVLDIARPEWQLLSSTVFFVEDAISSRVIKICKTNENGEFRLEVPQGFYVIRFGESSNFRIPEGAFSVEIDPASPELVLNVKLTTLCGGLYAVRADN